MATFERTDRDGYAVARHIFGKEPTDPEIYQFVLENYQELKFGELKEFNLTIKRVNPKRAQKLARREMERIKETAKPSTIAQDYMREELEKNKKAKKERASSKRRQRDEQQFDQKLQKRKEKRRGR